jgi:hypothetical protein
LEATDRQASDVALAHGHTAPVLRAATGWTESIEDGVDRIGGALRRL